ASPRRLVGALSDGDDRTRGPARAVAVRTVPLAPSVSPVTRRSLGLGTAGRDKVPTRVRPAGPHLLRPSQGPPRHSISRPRHVRRDLAPRRGRRRLRAGPTLPEPPSTGRSRTPPRGRVVLRSTCAGLRHRDRKSTRLNSSHQII